MDRLVSDETFEQRPERSTEAHHVALWRSLQAEGEASLDWGAWRRCIVSNEEWGGSRGQRSHGLNHVRPLNLVLSQKMSWKVLGKGMV